MWALVNRQGNYIQYGFHVFPYLGPAPPLHSGTHHYIFEIYSQGIFLKNNIQSQMYHRYTPLKH